jgi:hypothetical protein
MIFEAIFTKKFLVAPSTKLGCLKRGATRGKFALTRLTLKTTSLDLFYLKLKICAEKTLFYTKKAFLTTKMYILYTFLIIFCILIRKLV